MTDDIVNMVHREVEKALQRYQHAKTGLVTGYDPKTHSAKVMHQPDGTETGFMPIMCHAAGKAVSHVVGPTPGDGKKTGDQAIVMYLNGDIENPFIAGYLHSDVDPPPEVQSGEQMIRHVPQSRDSNNSGSQSGSTGSGTSASDGSTSQGNQQHKTISIFIDKNGKITHTGNDQGMFHNTQDSGPISVTTPDKGVITIDAKQGEVKASGDKSVSVKSKQKISIDAAKGQVSVLGKPVDVDDLKGEGVVNPDPVG